jgi:hypothetical protein
VYSREPSEERSDQAAVKVAADLADLAVTPAATNGAYADRILALQRTAGNAAVHRMLARGVMHPPPLPARRLARDVPVPAPGEAAAAVAAAAADWVAVVPDAQDTVITEFDAAAKSQKVVHHAAKGAAAPGPLDPAVQATVDTACAAVVAYRDTLPQPVVTSGITNSQGKTWTGTSWTRYSGLQAGGPLRPPPAPTKKNPNPVDPRTDAQKQAYDSQRSYIDWTSQESAAIGTMTAPAAGEDTTAYRKWLGDRLYFDIGSMEGGFDSINVYDSQIVTWGAGLGGASGFVADAMSNMAQSTLTGGGKVVGEEVTKILHAAGIAFEDAGGGRQRFVVLDPVSQRKYRGASALHLIKADNRLLMLFTNLARGELPGLDVDTAAPGGQPGSTLKEAARRAAFEGQRHVFLDIYGGSGFKSAVSALGPTWPYDSLMMVLHLHWWGLTGWQTFKDTGGDMRAIIKKTYTLGKYVTTRNGANVAVRDLAKHLQDFGAASSKALWGAEQQLSDDALESGAYYVETVPEVVAADAVADTVKDGKVIKKGKAAVAHQDPKYRKLQ